MGKPSELNRSLLHSEYIGVREQTRGSETSQYPEEKKTMSDSGSSGERTRKKISPNLNYESDWGVAGPR